MDTHTEDRQRRQEEMEAMEAIYGEDFTLDSEDSCTIKVSPPGSSVATLSLHLASTYPSLSPPSYSYFAPFLSSQEKETLRGSLEEIYLENLGQPVVFLWVECVRDFLNSRQEEIRQYEEDKEEEVLEEIVKQQQVFAEIQKREAVERSVCPVIVSGPTIEDRKSVFQGHTAVVTSQDEVTSVIQKLMENGKIARAAHNMYAYRIQTGDQGVTLQDCQDDGEDAAGGRMLHLLQVLDVKNVLVVVTRWYGGILLGPDRFKHINNASRQVLELAGYLTDKTVKKKKK